MTRPTPESLAALLALAEKATPGPWKTCATEAMPVAAQAALVAKNIENRAGDRVWGAYAPNHPEYEGGTALVWTALVGNGPDSEANAAYIAAASPEVVAGLVAEIARLRELLAKVRADYSVNDVEVDDAIALAEDR